MTTKYCIHCGESLDGAADAVGHYSHYHPDERFERSWYSNEDDEAVDDDNTVWIPFAQEPARKTPEDELVYVNNVADMEGHFIFRYAAHDPSEVRVEYRPMKEAPYIDL